MHIIQRTFLKRLKIKNGLTFSSITKDYNSENNAVFHLNQLLNKNLISKQNNKYYLTANGVQEIPTFHLSTLKEINNKAFVIAFLCTYSDQILIKKHTNGNSISYKLPANRPFFGENINIALTRIFYEITGLELPSTNFTYHNLHLMTMTNSKKEVVFDDAVGVYTVPIIQKDFTQIKLKNGLMWVNKNQISRLKNKWPEIDICILKKNWQPYQVYSFSSNYI
jgi:hypothetical protein